MSRTLIEKSEMTNKKANSPKIEDRLVMDELLEMGFSYNSMGTHYLHDSIVYAASMKLEDFDTVSSFCRRVAVSVRVKYGIGDWQYGNAVAYTIERAFLEGNINYLLDTFKNSYDYGNMKVSKNAFIMTVRKKIMGAVESQNRHNATQLRIITQGTIESIADISVLKAISDIVLALQKGGAV